MSNAFVRDLSAHLGARIDQALSDFADRCEIVDIEMERARTAALTVLGVQFACLTLEEGADEQQFIELCRWHFRNAQQQYMRQEVA